MRSVTKKVIAIGLALRHKGTEGELKRPREYGQQLRLTGQILNYSRRVSQEVETLPAPHRRGVRGLGEQLETVADQVRRVVRQNKARVFAGLTQFLFFSGRRRHTRFDCDWSSNVCSSD